MPRFLPHTVLLPNGLSLMCRVPEQVSVAEMLEFLVSSNLCPVVELQDYGLFVNLPRPGFASPLGPTTNLHDLNLQPHEVLVLKRKRELLLARWTYKTWDITEV